MEKQIIKNKEEQLNEIYKRIKNRDKKMWQKLGSMPKRELQNMVHQKEKNKKIKKKKKKTQ